MEETTSKLAASEAKCAELEERLQQTTASCETLTQKIDELTAENDNLTQRVEDMEKEKEGTAKTIAMLEFNNEHNKDKVRNMELSNNDLKETIASLMKEKEELTRQLREGASGVIDQYIKEKDELEERLTKEKDEQLEKYVKEDKALREQLEGLMEIRLSYEKQIKQIEENNAAMHRKIGGVQTERDVALKEAAHTKSQKVDLEKKFDDLTKVKSTMEEEIITLKGTISNLEEKLSSQKKPAKEEELVKVKQNLREVKEKLTLAEVVSGEVEEQRQRVREVESKMAVMEEQHRQQIKTIALEAERQVAVKEQECQQTITSAYDQQDNETNSLVRQHREAIREAQEEAREKASALDSVVHEYQGKLKYEDQLADLTTQHEAHIKEVEATWKSRAEKMVRQREMQLQEEMDGLSQEWNKERRELERLTQVAAAAFRSGTDSVELLKKQVAAQRKELEEVKLNHGLGVALEEAAEFEYLKNILYQYMLGKGS
ncbi:hypothetical protein C7M84_001370 [Penaeus vannamei]|uniref:Uncharacterized protein n=1 Tax=Penaeus vannamei TaxID=6689 RepID=A0A3R7PX44_PENVA|nr:hypothetical protein C7M84_001370 [Penaeus vannamei]